ncbi:MAG TPA: hypothetical protein VFR55_11220 [Dehalococcoidia bacterium]|nr:hypothetical protein [Dehalococcoidia bacterium]
MRLLDQHLIDKASFALYSHQRCDLTSCDLTSCDLYPLESLAPKRPWLDQAQPKGWRRIFGHGTDQKAGRFARNQGRLTLSPVDLENPSTGPGNASD